MQFYYQTTIIDKATVSFHKIADVSKNIRLLIKALKPFFLTTTILFLHAFITNNP